MNGVTCPSSGSTTTMRELLFCPAAWVAWFEVGREQASAAQPLLKGDVYRRARRLQPSRRSRLRQWAADQVAIFVEHQDVRGEGVRRIKLA